MAKQQNPRLFIPLSSLPHFSLFLFSPGKNRPLALRAPSAYVVGGTTLAQNFFFHAFIFPLLRRGFFIAFLLLESL